MGKQPMNPINIMLVEDEQVVRRGLVHLLNFEPDIEVIAEAGDGREAIRKANALKPDVVVMDISMPGLNGIEATRQIRQQHPDVEVVVLTNHPDEEYVFKLLKVGAMGYVLKTAAPEDLVNAVRSVLRGETYLSPSVQSLVVRQYVQRTDSDQQPDSLETLTNREREVLQLVAEGHSNAEIAEILVLSENTVGVHRNNLMKKLDLHNVGDVIHYAIQKGVIRSDRRHVD